jgi:hypothetical protein
VYDTQTSSDIRWVYVEWPCPFNCIYHRGVAAIAGSVHLMISRLGREGEAWPHPKQHHPVPQGPPLSNKYWLATGSSQAISIKPHSFLKAKTHTTASRPCCHTTRTRAHLISFGVGVTPPHCHSSVPVYTASLTDMPTTQRSTREHSKVTPCRRHAHPSPKPRRSLHQQSTDS